MGKLPVDDDNWGPDVVLLGFGLHNIYVDPRSDKGFVALCPTRAASEAAMRLFGGRELGYYVVAHIRFRPEALARAASQKTPDLNSTSPAP